MTLNLTIPTPAAAPDLKPRITVFGVGGAGGNAVDNMIAKDLDGVEFVCANTDAQALTQTRATQRVQLGTQVTEGLGAGAKPQIGAQAAEESIEQIIDHLHGAHMCFITAGMGGGTGTGAAPIIAAAARQLGVLTIGVVTKPFSFEGTRRMRQAEAGIEALQKVVDTLIVIPNQNLFRLAKAETTFTQAFGLADDVLYQGVKGVTDLMVMPGIINLDFADVRSVMDEMGKAMMGTGQAGGDDGPERARIAAERAVTNPLLDGMSLKGAKGVLVNVTGGKDLTLFELDEAVNLIRDQVDEDANIIVGSCEDEALDGIVRVSVVATGIEAEEAECAPPMAHRPLSAVGRPTPEPAPAPAPIPEPVLAAAPEPVHAAHAAPEPVEPAPVLHEVPREAYRPVPAAVMEDDLPPPAYVAPEPQPAPEPAVARAPGAPTPETLARLREAAARGDRLRVAAERTEPSVRRPGGIGGLIGRMTGGAEAPEADPAQEQLEVPAFLRRQAN